MANFTGSKTGGTIKWGSEDWLAGLIPNVTSDPSTNKRMLGTKGLSYASAADPFTHFGSMAPGAVATPITVGGSAFTITCEAVCEAGDYIWGFFSDNKIRIFNSSGVEVVAGSFPYTMSTAMADFTSCVVYNGYIYFRYNLVGADLGKSDIGRFLPVTGATVDETFMSVTAASGAKMDTTSTQMTVGEDQRLYLIDGANVHSYNASVGVNGTLYLDKFQLVGGTVTAYAKVPNFLVLFVNQTGTSASSGDCFAYWWDYDAPKATYIYPITGYEVIAAFQNFQGTHGAVIRGKSGFTNALGVNNCSVVTFQGGQYGYSQLLNLPVATGYNGVDNTQDFLFLNIQGLIYQYGSYYPGIKNSLQITLGNYIQNGIGGIFKRLSSNGSAIGVTYDGVSNYPLSVFSYNYSSSCTYGTPQFVPPIPFDYRCKVESVYINWGKVTSGGHGININLLTNKANTSIAILSNQTVVTEAGLYQKILMDTSGKQLGAYKFDSIGFEVSYTAGVSTAVTPPIIQSLGINYIYEKI